MRLLLFADLHLDAAFAWAGRDGARRCRQAIRDTLVNILALAGKLRPDAILCAGDLYEHDRATLDTGAFLRSRFEEVGVPIYIAPGNHDFLAPRSLYKQIDWPANVTIFEQSVLTAVELAPGLRLWGSAHRKAAGTEGFFESGFYTGGGAVDLALFHGSEEFGFRFESNSKSPHAEFSAEQIEQSGLRHAFVGHFHAPAEKAFHTYPGNPQPLTFGEKGVRGAVEVDVGEDGKITRKWHRVAASWAHDIPVDLSGAASSDDVRDRVTAALDGKTGVAKVSLTGELASEIEIDLQRLQEVPHELDALPVLDASAVSIAYDLDTIGEEQTVRGQFVRDVRGSNTFEDEADRRRVLITGLRALDGRDDLEVFV